MTTKYTISETEDYELVSLLMQSSGLGVELSTHHHDGIKKMWRMDDENGNIMGAVVFHFRGGVYTLGGLAVNDFYRGQNCGRILLNVLYEEARAQGLTELWTCAKIPDYYKKMGWEIMPWETSPKVATYCPNCRKYEKNCFPVIMRYDLSKKHNSELSSAIEFLVKINETHTKMLSNLCNDYDSIKRETDLNTLLSAIEDIKKGTEKLKSLL